MMRTMLLFCAGVFGLGLAWTAVADEPKTAAKPKKRLLVITESQGFRHDCVTRKGAGKRIAASLGIDGQALPLDKVIVWDADSGDKAFSLRGHTSLVWSVAFSPDGTRIATASHDHDNTVKMWDADKGALLFTIKGFNTRITHVAFSPDGKRVVTASGSKVEVWDADKGAKVASIEEDWRTVGYISWVAFSPDGKHIANSGGDTLLKVWDVDKRTQVFSLKGHKGLITGIAFSPDGKRIVTSSQDFTLKVWDVDKRAEFLTLKGHTNLVNGVAFSPDGKRIVSGSGDGTVRVWDAENGAVIHSLKAHASVITVAYSPDGKRIASAGCGLNAEGKPYSGDLKIWDAAKGTQTLFLKGHSNCIQNIAFSPDGLSLMENTLIEIAKNSGDFEAVCSQDSRTAITAENLAKFDAVFFYTTGELPLSDTQKSDLLQFIRKGKGFAASHSATDTFYKWPEYGKLIGGYFDGHPWNQKIDVIVEDPKHPATRHLGEKFSIADEIYQFKSPYDRKDLHILLRMDVKSVNNPGKRKDGDYALSWVREYDKGRVFYTALGHRDEVWRDERFQKHILGGLRYVLGLEKGDANPSGELKANQSGN